MIILEELNRSISSSIAGGNFWAGARQGIITSALKENNIELYATFMPEVGAYSMNIAYAEDQVEYIWAKKQQANYELKAKKLLKQ